MKISRSMLQIGSSISLLLLLFTLVGSAAVVYAAALAPANGGVISGQVSSPSGYPLPAGTLVKLFDAGEEYVHGIAQPDLADGSFQFGPAPNGLYVIKAVPPAGSGYTQSLPKPVSIVNAPVNVGVLALTEPQIFGSVVAPDGVILVDAEVLVFLGSGQVIQHVDAEGGRFLVGGLPVGGYALQATPTGDAPYWKSPLESLLIQHPGEAFTVTLRLRSADLWGTIQDDQGNPVPGARVIVADNSGEHGSDLSNANGYWAIGGLDAGVYRLSAIPPWSHSGLLPPQPLEVTLPGATNPYPLVFGSPIKIVQGTVSANTGQPVFHAQVLARRVNLPGQAHTLSAADGSYRLDLSPGVWALTVRPISDTLPTDWVYPYPPQWVYFHQDDDPESRDQDFTVIIPDAAVSGIVQMPDGSAPPFTVTVSLHNDEGVGLRAQADPLDGSFDLAVPNGGYKVVVHPQNQGYLGPAVDPIHAPPNGALDLGTLTLLPRDAVISGTIRTDGSPVAGIPVVAWRQGIPGSLRTTSGLDGAYALAVSEGRWHVQPAPGADQAYLYTGAGEQVDIQAGGVAPEVDFDLLAADAIISGVLVNESGEPVIDAYGWAAAYQVRAPEIHNGAPIEAGLFSIHVPAGTYNLAAHLPTGGPYTSAGERRVTVGSGGSVNVTLTVQVKDAQISGALWDPRNQDVVEGVAGWVGAWFGENWAAAPINDGNGSYRLGVAAGLWHLDYQIDPQAGYAKINSPLNVPVQSGQTAVAPLGILPKDGTISGVVLAPDGAPLAGATLLAKGIGPHIQNIWLQATSGQDGRFSIAAPHGRYRLGAAFNQPDWLKPYERQVEVLPGGVSGGHILQFRQADMLVSGILTVTNAVEAGQVHVWAWSDDGAFTRERFPVELDGDTASGPYQLGLISGTAWRLGAVFETSSQYWFGQARIPASDSDLLQDIVLHGPYPKPAPVVVTFDSATPQHISLADGTHIFVPAGAMPVEGMVTLRIVPLAALPHQQHANVYRYGYTFLATDQNGEPIEAHFNQDVVISFKYEDAELVGLHIHESWLKPAYFSTTTDRWTFPESFVIDAQANRVVMQIDHFTDYALTSIEGYAVYLPLTMR